MNKELRYKDIGLDDNDDEFYEDPVLENKDDNDDDGFDWDSDEDTYDEY